MLLTDHTVKMIRLLRRCGDAPTGAILPRPFHAQGDACGRDGWARWMGAMDGRDGWARWMGATNLPQWGVVTPPAVDGMSRTRRFIPDPFDLRPCGLVQGAWDVLSGRASALPPRRANPIVGPPSSCAPSRRRCAPFSDPSGSCGDNPSRAFSGVHHRRPRERHAGCMSDVPGWIDDLWPCCHWVRGRPYWRMI